MKIGTFVRTFRGFEEKTIEQFLDSHSFCDVIYVGLCQTSDKTWDILCRYPNVKTKLFTYVTDIGYNNWTAHEGKYYQFLNQWSQEEDLDFVLFDDADHIVNPALQRDARRLIEKSNAPFAYTLLMYVWGTEYYFPELNPCCPQERLWGWNPHKWQPDINPDHPLTVEIRNQPDRDIENGLVFPHPPYTLLHYSWLTEEDTRRKMAFNHARGVPQQHPLLSCGRLEPIPEWAK